jgi:malate dehydrogenase (oxaloacetate-decarboxylating)(NADP+)
VDQRYPFSQVRTPTCWSSPRWRRQHRLQAAGRLGAAQAIGPILLGMGAPVHVLQTGDEVRDIVNIAAVAVMDAIDRE